MNKSNRLCFGKELLRLAKTNDFIVFNADTKGCGIESFGESYPDRNYTFGIAEQNLLAAAAGAALCGEKVFLSTFAVFASMRACEQIRTFICYPRLNVTILASHGGLQTGADGATHIAIEDVSIMRSLPNMTIVEPSDYVAAEKLVQKAIDFQGPLYIRFPKADTPQIHSPGQYELKIGKSNLICEGTDVTLIATGWILSRVLEAADKLRGQGISSEIIEMHTVKPLDVEAVLHTAEKTGAIVTIEDNTIMGGLGSAIAEVLIENTFVPMKCIGILDNFGESGEPELLYKKNKMTVNDIVEAAFQVIARKRRSII